MDKPNSSCKRGDESPEESGKRLKKSSGPETSSEVVQVDNIGPMFSNEEGQEGPQPGPSKEESASYADDGQPKPGTSRERSPEAASSDMGHRAEDMSGENQELDTNLFDMLPPEIACKIFRYLDGRSLIAVIRTCRRFRALCREDYALRNRVRNFYVTAEVNRQVLRPYDRPQIYSIFWVFGRCLFGVKNDEYGHRIDHHFD